MTRIALVTAYLGAIVAANLTLGEWGRDHPEVALYNAFALIGLDLTSRDVLHGHWATRRTLLRNMAALIAAGSALSYLAGVWLGSGPDVGRIALASCIAFAAAAACDAAVYQTLHGREWLEKVNGSNLVSSAIDSLVFVGLVAWWNVAFGIGSGFPFVIAFGLFNAKVAGGVAWSLVLQYLKPRRAETWEERNRRLWAPPAGIRR